VRKLHIMYIFILTDFHQRSTRHLPSPALALHLGSCSTSHSGLSHSFPESLQDLLPPSRLYSIPNPNIWRFRLRYLWPCCETLRLTASDRPCVLSGSCTSSFFADIRRRAHNQRRNHCMSFNSCHCKSDLELQCLVTPYHSPFRHPE
jgi:hypothetical protein